MKHVLEFDLKAVLGLMEDARGAKRNAIGFEERCEIYGETVYHCQPDEEERAEPGLFFVKDDGVYLMSSGRPEGLDPETGKPPRPKVAYAKGFDPTLDDRADVWDRAQIAVGGDDFSDKFMLGVFDDLMPGTDSRGTFRITVDNDSLQLTVRARRTADLEGRASPPLGH